jgi:transcriptional regulator with XRE-family HTH domain
MDVRRLVGENVRRLRARKGWSQEQLAFESGLHRTYISGVERGARNPTVMVLKELADALGASPADLLRPTAPRRRP